MSTCTTAAGERSPPALLRACDCSVHRQPCYKHVTVAAKCGRFVINPATVAHRCSMVEIMASDEQPPDFFVSHFWAEPILDFLLCIERHSEARGLERLKAYQNGARTNNHAFYLGGRSPHYWVCRHPRRVGTLTPEPRARVTPMPAQPARPARLTRPPARCAGVRAREQPAQSGRRDCRRPLPDLLLPSDAPLAWYRLGGRRARRLLRADLVCV